MVRNCLFQQIVCLCTRSRGLESRINLNSCVLSKSLSAKFVNFHSQRSAICSPHDRSFCTNSNGSNVVQLKLKEFCEIIEENRTRRCLIWYDKKTQKIEVSHGFLQEVADYVSKNEHFSGHEAIFMELGRRTNALLTAFLWKTNRGQAHGGVRLWNYETVANVINEGLRLSAANGAKAALAGLWMSGGQGIIPELPDKQHLVRDFRQQLFFDYGDFLSGLNGSYVAAEDIGLNVYDMNNIHMRTRYLTGTGEDTGGLGNPAFATAEGVVCAMEGALDFLELGNLEDKNICVQGVGNVGSIIISEMLDRGVASIYATECHQKKIDDITDLLADKAKGRLEIVKVPYGDQKILLRKCDILCPCALGNIITSDTLSMIQARIICGPAANQVSPEVDNQSLMDSGVVFVGDFIVNRMGMVIQAVEPQGRLRNDPAFKQHFNKDWENSIFVVTKKILNSARETNSSANHAAMAIAEKLVEERNPLWPERNQMIIRDLIDSRWFDDKDFWLRRSNFPSARNVW